MSEPTLRKVLSGREINDFITEEVLLVHPIVEGNYIEAGAYVYIEIDGIEYEANKIIRLRVKRGM